MTYRDFTRHRSPHRRSVAALLAVACMQVAAFGQPSGSTGASAPAPVMAPEEAFLKGKALVRQGDASYDAGAYDEAIQDYQAAYLLLPLPDILFNIAQAYRLKGDKVSAVQYYQKFLILSRGPGSEQARKHLDELTREIEREGGHVDPEAPVSTQPSTPAMAAQPTTDVAPHDEALGERSWLPYAVGATGVLLAGTGAVLAITAGREFDRLESACAPTCDPALWQSYEMRASIGNGLMIGGGIVGVAGVVWWLLDRRTADVTPPSVSVRPSRHGFLVQGEF